jgi:hypothetical protein
MQLKVTVQANYKKFDEFRKAIEPVLEKIAISKSTTVIKESKSNSFDGWLDSSKTINCYVNTSRNAQLSNTGFNAYKLPDKAVAILSPYTLMIPAFDVLLCDSNGDTILTERVAGVACKKEISYRGVEGYYGGFCCGLQRPCFGTDKENDVIGRIERGSVLAQRFNGYRDDSGYAKNYLLFPFCYYEYNVFSNKMVYTPVVKIEASELKKVKTMK